MGKAQATSTSLRIQGKEVSVPVAGPVLHSKASTATTGLTRCAGVSLLVRAVLGGMRNASGIGKK